MIAGLEMPTAGRILIGGADVTRAAGDRPRRVDGLPVLRALPAHDGDGERLLRPAASPASPKRETAAPRRGRLALVGLTGFEARFPSELSGGQQQRVAVARALVLEPQVLLFDEPLSNLDAKLRRRVREEIRELQQELGLTVVYVTHDQDEALAVSDRIIVMDHAVIAQAGAPRELYDAPATAFVADFIGESNILPCRSSRSRTTAAEVRIGPVASRSRSSRAGARPGPSLGPPPPPRDRPCRTAEHLPRLGAEGDLRRKPRRTRGRNGGRHDLSGHLRNHRTAGRQQLGAARDRSFRRGNAAPLTAAVAASPFPEPGVLAQETGVARASARRTGRLPPKPQVAVLTRSDRIIPATAAADSRGIPKSRDL